MNRMRHCAGMAPIAALMSFFGLAGGAQALELRDIVGEWRLPESGETIVIRRSGEWYHPKYGRARIRRAETAADFNVIYQGEKIRCQYRASLADNGNTLVLAAAEASQNPEYCPVGDLKSVDR